MNEPLAELAISRAMGWNGPEEISANLAVLEARANRLALRIQEVRARLREVEEHWEEQRTRIREILAVPGIELVRVNRYGYDEVQFIVDGEEYHSDLHHLWQQKTQRGNANLHLEMIESEKRVAEIRRVQSERNAKAKAKREAKKAVQSQRSQW